MKSEAFELCFKMSTVDFLFDGELLKNERKTIPSWISIEVQQSTLNGSNRQHLSYKTKRPV